MKNSINIKKPSIIDLHGTEYKQSSETDNLRPIITEKHLETNYEFQKLKSDNVFKSTKIYLFKSFRPSPGCCKNFLKGRLPVIDWLPNYNLKENILNDFIGGMAVRFNKIGYFWVLFAMIHI